MTAPAIDLDLPLSRGAHSAAEPNYCLIEWHNVKRGRPKTDSRPEGMSPYLHRFAIRLNDVLPDDKRQLLKAFDARLEDTDDGRDRERSWIALDWAAHVSVPRWLDAAKLTEEAAQLRALPAVTDAASNDSAHRLLAQIRDKTWKIRSEWREQLREKVREAVLRSGETDAAFADAADAAFAAVAFAAVAVAAFVAFADVDADAAFAAVAVAAFVAAAAVDAAAAVAAAFADAAAGGSWDNTYDAVYAKVREIYEAKFCEAFPGLVEQSQDDAIALFDRLIDCDGWAWPQPPAPVPPVADLPDLHGDEEQK